MIFGVGTGRREGFGATTGREAISAQDIFFGVAIGVAGGVSGSEVSMVGFDWLIGGVSINAGSLVGGGVAGGVGFAIGAMDVRSAATAFGVEGGVTGADVAIGVVAAGSSAGFVGFFVW